MYKAVLILAIILIGLYLFMFPETITNIISDKGIEIKIGETATWTNENFSTVVDNPTDYTGDHVRVNGFYFNAINISGTNDVVGLEVFLGSKDDLLNNPLDTNRRILVGVSRSVEENLPVGTCIMIDGTIKGEARVTTMDGTIINPVYVESNSVTEINCTQ